MNIKIKVYVAGKVSPNSVFGTHDWRDGFCKELSEKSGFEILNLDPVKLEMDFNFDHKDSKMIVGKDCFLIKDSDIVIVNLTDDISVGGSQEMLIAKYYKKPLIGIAPRGGKFNKDEKEILGKKYKDYTDPFVAVSCDRVVENIDECAKALKDYFGNPKIKTIEILDEALEYYQKKTKL